MCQNRIHYLKKCNPVLVGALCEVKRRMCPRTWDEINIAGKNIWQMSQPMEGLGHRIFFTKYVSFLCYSYIDWTDLLTPAALLWRHNGWDGVWNHQPHDCLRNRLFGRRSKKTSKFRVTGLCAGNSPVTDEFPAHMASNAKKISIWWRHHVYHMTKLTLKTWFER